MEVDPSVTRALPKGTLEAVLWLADKVITYHYLGDHRRLSFEVSRGCCSTNQRVISWKDVKCALIGPVKPKTAPIVVVRWSSQA